mgnify:CR=1 FL=1
MILESIAVIGFAILLDLVFGDPRNRYHPTAWIGNLIGIITPRMKNQNNSLEKLGGIFIVLIPVSISCIILTGLQSSIDLINFELLYIILSVVAFAILFKLTIAIRGMQTHALDILDAVQKDDLTLARKNLSMIVKRNTKDLDKKHILSGTLESLSENIVDGITGPMFYFALFGLPGAFAYRIVNTVDSMEFMLDKIRKSCSCRTLMTTGKPIVAQCCTEDSETGIRIRQSTHSSGVLAVSSISGTATAVNRVSKLHGA